MLAAYDSLIRELLGKDPSRSAVTILQVLRQSGYRGGITILKDYLRTCRPVSEPKAYLSLTFLPGQAAQVDWGEFGDVFGWGRKIHAFVMVLCFSRLLYLEFTASATFESFVRCHERALKYFVNRPPAPWGDFRYVATGESRVWGRLGLLRPVEIAGTGFYETGFRRRL
jgi:transposase